MEAGALCPCCCDIRGALVSLRTQTLESNSHKTQYIEVGPEPVGSSVCVPLLHIATVRHCTLHNLLTMDQSSVPVTYSRRFVSARTFMYLEVMGSIPSSPRRIQDIETYDIDSNSVVTEQRCTRSKICAQSWAISKPEIKFDVEDYCIWNVTMFCLVNTYVSVYQITRHLTPEIRDLHTVTVQQTTRHHLSKGST